MDLWMQKGGKDIKVHRRAPIASPLDRPSLVIRICVWMQVLTMFGIVNVLIWTYPISKPLRIPHA